MWWQAAWRAGACGGKGGGTAGLNGNTCQPTATDRKQKKIAGGGRGGGWSCERERRRGGCWLNRISLATPSHSPLSPTTTGAGGRESREEGGRWLLRVHSHHLHPLHSCTSSRSDKSRDGIHPHHPHSRPPPLTHPPPPTQQEKTRQQQWGRRKGGWGKMLGRDGWGVGGKLWAGPGVAGAARQADGGSLDEQAHGRHDECAWGWRW
ncbi:unnamed protein product [Closterium sp. NIES-53]